MTFVNGMLNRKGQCCGKKPRVYEGKGFALCRRCDKAYDLTYGTQIENYAWVKITGGMFAPRLSVTDGDNAQLLYVRTKE